MYRHLARCHTPHAIVAQIEKKHERSDRRQSTIQRLLSGFNTRKLTVELARQMKQLLKLLLTEDSRITMPDDPMETSRDDTSLDSMLLEGYRDIGLTEL